MISSFLGSYRFLSQFQLCKVRFRNLDFGSAEAAYQSGKSDEESVRRQFCSLGPSEAKRLGQTVKLIPKWNEGVSLATMAEVIHCKYTQNKDLRKMLVDTHPHVLEEGNFHGDIFWGTVGGVGKNWSGRLSMAERAYWMNIAETEPLKSIE